MRLVIMRLLVLVYEFPPIGGGGGRSAQDLYSALVKQGYQVKLVTSHFRGLARSETVDGIEVLRVPAFRTQMYKAGILTMLAYIVFGLIPSLSIACRWRPDLIHVHFAVPSGALAWLVHKLTGIPYLLTAHLGDVPGGTPEKTSRWFRVVYPFTLPIWRSASRVVAVSQFTRQLALQHYPVEIQVIPNGVDTTDLDPGKIQVGEPPRIVFAGRIVEQKNPLQIIRSLAAVRDLPWECTLLGDGDLRPVVDAEIKRYDLGERIQLLGWVPPEEVIDWFRRSDVLFIPSRSEGLPVVGVQALAMGLAIVASDIGGWADLVSTGLNGFLIDPNQPEYYEQAFRSLLSQQSMLLSFRTASRIKAESFDLSRITAAYSQVYREICG